MSTSINLPKVALWIVWLALAVGGFSLLLSGPVVPRNPGTVTSPYHAHAIQPAGLRSP